MYLNGAGKSHRNNIAKELTTAIDCLRAAYDALESQRGIGTEKLQALIAELIQKETATRDAVKLLK